MLSKAATDISYYCKEPLSANTTWLAVPIFISAKGKNTASAFEIVERTMNSVPEILTQLPTSPFSASLLGFDTSFEDMKSTMEFYELNESDYQARLYNYVMIKFPEKGQFMAKMKFVSSTLDQLYAFAKQYKSDKNITVQLGEKYRFNK